MLRRLGTPSVTTLHGRLDLPELPALYGLYGDVPVVSISNSQRVPLPQANYVATVLHGLPQNLLAKGAGRGGYLAFLGRISPEKAPDAAIRIAAQAGMPLKIAAKVDRVDEEYFKTHDRAAAARSATSSSSARSARIRSRNFWATPRRCCSRSHGASRSGW